jgi:hypothetical protein
MAGLRPLAERAFDLDATLERQAAQAAQVACDGGDGAGTQAVPGFGRTELLAQSLPFDVDDAATRVAAHLTALRAEMQARQRAAAALTALAEAQAPALEGGDAAAVASAARRLAYVRTVRRRLQSRQQDAQAAEAAKSASAHVETAGSGPSSAGEVGAHAASEPVHAGVPSGHATGAVAVAGGRGGTGLMPTYSPVLAEPVALPYQAQTGPARGSGVSAVGGAASISSRWDTPLSRGHPSPDKYAQSPTPHVAAQGASYDYEGRQYGYDQPTPRHQALLPPAAQYAPAGQPDPYYQGYAPAPAAGGDGGYVGNVGPAQHGYGLLPLPPPPPQHQQQQGRPGGPGYSPPSGLLGPPPGSGYGYGYDSGGGGAYGYDWAGGPSVQLAQGPGLGYANAYGTGTGTGISGRPSLMGAPAQAYEPPPPQHGAYAHRHQAPTQEQQPPSLYGTAWGPGGLHSQQQYATGVSSLSHQGGLLGAPPPRGPSAGYGGGYGHGQ